MHLIRIFSDCTHIKMYGPHWSSEKKSNNKKGKAKDVITFKQFW